MELYDAVLKYALDEILPEDLPAIGQEALQHGQDCPSLRQLAGGQGLDYYRLRSLFEKSLEELGLSIPPPIDAGLATAKRIARDILEGSVTPYSGAKTIWSSVYTRFPALVQLRPFVGLASEIEDDVAHRTANSLAIVEECKRLLAE